MTKMKKILSLMLALVLAGSLLAAPVSAVTLTDIESSWAKNVILYGVEAGYISGFGDGTFRPNDSVTRAQFAKMLNNAIGIKNASEPKFSDVGQTAWYYDEVSKAVCAQYIAGYNDGTFRPDATITRQEAAVMLSRIVTAPQTMLSSAQFGDAAKIDGWAKDSVDFVYSKGYMKGDNHNNFDPKGNLTRAQAAQLIYSLLQGEKIVSTANEPVMVTTENVLFANHVTVSSTSDVALRNCRVLGTMSVGSTNVTLDGTSVNDMNVVGEDITVTATGNSLIKTTTVRAGTTLAEKELTGEGFRDVTLTGDLSAAMVRLDGSFETVEMQTGTVLRHTGGTIGMMNVTKKSNITMQQGSIDRLNVTAEADGTAMILSGDVTVQAAFMDGAAAFRGTGTIAVATENAAGCTYETQPTRVISNVQGGGDSTDQTKLTVTVVPARGTANVAPTSPITLVFSENIYTAAGGSVSSTYLHSNVLTLTRSNGTAVEFTASVSGRTVTVTPTATLADGATYQLTIAANTLATSKGVKNDAFSTYFTTASASAGAMTPTVEPANGATAVSTTPVITLTFDSVLFNANGSTLTASYIENSVAKLFVGSTTGTEVVFTAAIGADRKTITLTPDEPLAMNTTYYLVLQNRALRSSENVYNNTLTTSFTTGEQQTLQPTSISPRDGATSVSKATSVTLNFSETLYRSLGVTLTANYVRDSVVELHEGSVSGPAVTFTATLGSNNRAFTLKPIVVLAADTTYYVVVKAGTMVTASGAANSGYIARFSTGRDVESDLVFSPANDATNVSVSGPFSVTFPQAVTRPNANGLKESYVEATAIELRRGSVSGTKTEFSASVSADSKTITITPTSDLAYRTKYYVVVAKDALTYLDGTYVGTANAGFTTEDSNPVSVTIGEPTSTSVTFSVTTEVAGPMTISYRSGGKSTTLVAGLSFAAGETRSYTVSDLTAGSSCSVTASMVYNGVTYSKTETFTASASSASTKLDEITLTAGSDTYVILASGSSATNLTVTPASATGAVLRAKPLETTVASVDYAIGANNAAAYQPMTKGTDGAFTLEGLDIVKGETLRLYLRVTAENGKTQTYNITITCNI